MIGAFNDLTDYLTECAEGARNQMQDNYQLMADEEDISARFTQEFESQVRRIDSFVSPTLIPRTITLPRRYPYSESKFGADFAVAFKLDLESYSYGVGILVQAKQKESTSYDKKDPSGLREDGEKMLNCSPDSFICIFSSTTFRHYPASSISGLNQNRFVHGQDDYTMNQACPSYKVGDFYEMFFEGYIGDKWVYKNLDYLSRPDQYTATARQAIPDGGQSEEEGRGITTFLVVATDSPDDFDPYDDLPYDEQFVSEQLPSDPEEKTTEQSGQMEFDDFM